MSGRMSLPETKKIILRVNDRDNIDSEFYSEMLKRGAVVLQANSTEYALKLLSRVHADAVITDLHRNEGSLSNPTAGLELCRAIREEEDGSRVPIIMYTMNVQSPLEDLAKVAGADEVTVYTNELYEWLESIGI